MQRLKKKNKSVTPVICTFLYFIQAEALLPVERTGIKEGDGTSSVLLDLIALDQVLIFPAAMWLDTTGKIGGAIHLERERRPGVLHL